MQEEINESFAILSNIAEYIQEKNYVLSSTEFFEDLISSFAEKFSNPLYPDEIESDYTGIHLGPAYEESDFSQMIESFSHNQTLHAKYVWKILFESRQKYKLAKNISECNLNISKTELPGVIIVGDLHGNFHDLNYIIKKFGIPGKNYRFVFNGDFVDRGLQQIEVLVTLLYAFMLYPNRVFLNRGNHEDKSLNLSKNFNPNFKKDICKKYGKYASAIFNEAIKTFRYLPLATIVQNKVNYRVFITHGGIDTNLNFDYIQNKLPRREFSDMHTYDKSNKELKYAAEQLATLLWSDPSNSKGCLLNKTRGIGKLFGPDISDEFCKQYGFSCIVRSHEVRSEGYSKDHPKLHTIFSCSNYCGASNYAAVLILKSHETSFDIHKFKSPVQNETKMQKERNQIIKTVRRYLESKASILMEKFKEDDPSDSGKLKIDIWAAIISDFLNNNLQANIQPKNIIPLRNFFCPIDDVYSCVYYGSMFANLYNESTNKSLDLLTTIFNLIDINNDGKLSAAEGAKAIAVINKLLNKNYDSRFISSMDSNLGKISGFIF